MGTPFCDHIRAHFSLTRSGSCRRLERLPQRRGIAPQVFGGAMALFHWIPVRKRVLSLRERAVRVLADDPNRRHRRRSGRPSHTVVGWNWVRQTGVAIAGPWRYLLGPSSPQNLHTLLVKAHGFPGDDCASAATDLTWGFASCGFAISLTMSLSPPAADTSQRIRPAERPARVRLIRLK